MKHLAEYRDPELAKALLAKIHATVTRPWTIMEICGGQTHSIMRFGIDQLLPDEITLPAGETAQAITQGTSWIGVVTTDASGIERIHILNLDGTPRQVVNITP